MELMGAIQPGLPQPVGIPAEYYLLVIDLKDCFFTIPLHPADSENFAFSKFSKIPSVNFQELYWRYQWAVLPQGMANSPTICQVYVSKAIVPIKDKYPQLYVIHYMDDILLTGNNQDLVLQAFADMQECLGIFGLRIAPENVQQHYPYQYLGHQLLQNGVRPQRIVLRLDKLQTLNNFQRLLGDINCLRPSLGISTGELKPLFDLLQGDSDPTSPRQLNPQARQCITLVEEKLSSAHVNYVDYSQPLLLLIFPSQHSPTGVFWQHGPILWVHEHASPAKAVVSYPSSVLHIIQKAYKHSIQIFGILPNKIITPYMKEQINWLQNFVDDWTQFLCFNKCKFDNHYPSDRIFQLFHNHPVCFPKIVSSHPLPEALNVFTDGSSKGKAVVCSQQDILVHHISTKSAQVAELVAVPLALEKYCAVPFNLFTDSIYIRKILAPLETAAHIAAISNVQKHLLQIQSLIWIRKYPFYVCHLRAHSDLPGPLSQGNALADQLTCQIYWNVSDPYEAASKA